MRFGKQDLLTLLIGLFIFNGCRTDDSVGLDPTQAIAGKLLDTVTVRTTTVRDDSINTSVLTKFPLGYLVDPVFGRTDASLAMTLNLPSANLTFGTTPVLDSAVLVLKYTGDAYGDNTVSYRADVYQLTERLGSATNYFNTRDRGFSPTVIGTRVFNINTKDSVKVTEIVKAAADKQVNKAPQIRIPINASFITTNFLNGAAANFVSSDKLNDFLKGFYVNFRAQTGPGAITLIDMGTSGDTRLELYYKNPGTTIDTTMVSFPIRADVLNSPVAGTFKHNYTGTPVATQLSNPAQQFTVNYVQGMHGVRTRVRFPYLDRLKSLGNISISKAELVVNIEGGSDALFAPAPRLTLYRTDIAAQRQPIPDGDTDPRSTGNVDPRSFFSAFGGTYNASTKRYTFIVTSYLQDIINGKSQQYDTYIAPMDAANVTTVDILPTAAAAGRSIVGSGTGTTYKMKLNIIYTRVN